MSVFDVPSTRFNCLPVKLSQKLFPLVRGHGLETAHNPPALVF
jgi:hypothetical protein